MQTKPKLVNATAKVGGAFAKAAGADFYPDAGGLAMLRVNCKLEITTEEGPFLRR